MPRLLKSETHRRLIVCQEALTLAFALLAKPKPLSYERKDSDGAIEMGLIGVAADLVISACLYEVFGASGIKRKNGFYIMASEALVEFRKMLTSLVPRISSLTQGVKDPSGHLKALDKASEGFGVLFTARATAVHAGCGTSYDVAFSVGKTVADFMMLLAQSPKWKPYLREVPDVPKLPKDRMLIAEELRNAALDGDSTALTGIFLVLPELVSPEPSWLASLERVQVTPRDNDISVLIKSLQNASIGDLFKVGKGSKGIAARIDASNPSALPVHITAFKKSFESPAESWGGYVGNANPALDKGYLSLPPIDAVYALSATGLDDIGLPEDISNGVSAHALWGFIAAALNYGGTKGPCFFLVQRLKPGEGGQLTAILKRAGAKSQKLNKALVDYLPLFTSIYEAKSVQGSSASLQSLIASHNKRTSAMEKLPEALANKAKSSTGDVSKAYETVSSLIKEPSTVGRALLAICDESITLGKDDKLPLVRLLLGAVSDKEDIEPLLAILGHEELKSLSTLVRQAVRDIDFAFYGPQIKA